MDKVTLIIPMYNCEKYIRRCLNSIINQTYKNLEIIVINDGSTDKSLSIVKEMAKVDSRIICINQKNMGVAKTRNKAISLATGKYIMFVDNDDYLDDDYIHNYVNVIEKTDYDVVIGGYRRITQDFKILHEEKLKNKPFSKYLMLVPWAKIYKRDFLIKNKFKFLDYIIGEDVYFSIDIYLTTNKIGIIDYVGYNWFYNTDSVSNTEHKGFKKNVDILFLLEKITKLKNYKHYKVLDYYFVRFSIWYLLYSGKNATSKEFFCEYQKIIKYFKEENIQRKNYFFTKEIKGEQLKTRLIVMFFLLIEKFHLIKLFSMIYCR